MDSAQQFWVCVCGFHGGFENVQLHFMNEHGNTFNDNRSLCRLCNLIFHDTGILKEHSLLHIRQNYDTQVEQLPKTSPSNISLHESLTNFLDAQNSSGNPSGVQNSFVTDSLHNPNDVITNPLANCSGRHNSVLAHSSYQQNPVLESAYVESATQTESSGSQLCWISENSDCSNCSEVQASTLENSSCIQDGAKTKFSETQANFSVEQETLISNSSHERISMLNCSHVKISAKTKASGNYVSPLRLLAESSEVQFLMSTSSSHKQNSALNPKQIKFDTQTKSSQNKIKEAEYQFNFRTLMLRKAQNMSNEYQQTWKDIKSADALKKMLTAGKLMHLYKCMERDCAFTTDSKNEFQSHLMGHNSCSKCVYCLIEFEIGHSLANHITEMHFRRIYQCSLCFYRASKKTCVKFHYQFYHEISSMEILTCSKLIGLDEINVPEIDAKPYKCALGSCCYMTSLPQEFRKHNEEYHGSVFSYPCSYCDYSGFSFNSLIKHCQNHGLNNFQCTYCVYGSNTKIELLVHLIVQHADMPSYLYVRSSDEPLEDLQSSLTDTKNVIATVNNKECGPDASNKSSCQPISNSTGSAVIKTVSVRNVSSAENFASSTGGCTDKDETTEFSNAKDCSRKPEESVESHSSGSKQNSLSFVQQSHSRVKKLPKKYKCAICSLSFKLFSGITSHLRDVHCLRGFLKCAYCTKFGINKQFLRRHVVSKHPKQNGKLISFININKKRKSLPKLYNCQYKCPFCPYGIQSRNKILEHMYEKELDYKKYQCAICEERFTHEKIVTHCPSAHPDYDFKFSIKRNLGIDYWLQNYLQDCVERSGQKSDQIPEANKNTLCCPFCNKGLKRAMQFLRHLYRHKENYPYKLHKKTMCRTENMFLGKRADVMKWAKGIVQNQIKKTIEIQKSGKLFRHNKCVKLDIHYAAIYKCYYCRFSTDHKYLVERHCWIKHYKQHQCFLTSGQVIHKTRRKYSKLLKCWQCGRKVLSPKYRKHTSEHGDETSLKTSVMFHCNQCESEYSSLQMLKKHWWLTHTSLNEPFSFQVATQKGKHELTNLYFYKCFYCNAKSVTMKNLRDHVKEFHPSEIFMMKISSAYTGNLHHPSADL